MHALAGKPSKQNMSPAHRHVRPRVSPHTLSLGKGPAAACAGEGAPSPPNLNLSIVIANINHLIFISLVQESPDLLLFVVVLSMTVTRLGCEPKCQYESGIWGDWRRDVTTSHSPLQDMPCAFCNSYIHIRDKLRNIVKECLQRTTTCTRPTGTSAGYRPSFPHGTTPPDATTP